MQWLKGFAIVLVVIGHFYSSVATPVWMERTRQVIYLFHMPLFMAISGFLYALSRPLPLGVLARKKFLRLMIPYISISGLVLFAKWMAEKLHFSLQYPLKPGDLLAFLLYPPSGFACFLWFIYTLFLIFVLVRVLEKARTPWVVLFLMALGLSMIPLPQVFCLNLVGANGVYFVFGMGLKRFFAMEFWDESEKEWALLGGSLAGFLALAWLMLCRGARGTILQEIVAFFGILFCWFLARRISGWRGGTAWTWIGASSSAIYLLHTICMGGVRYVWEHWLGANAGYSPIFYFGVAVLSALLIPALFQRRVLSRFPRVCKIFLGASM